MSHFLDRLKFMSRVKSTYADGHGEVVNEDRKWENAYRARWQHDKVVRSTHGVNCTGSWSATPLARATSACWAAPA